MSQFCEKCGSRSVDMVCPRVWWCEIMYTINKLGSFLFYAGLVVTILGIFFWPLFAISAPLIVAGILVAVASAFITRFLASITGTALSVQCHKCVSDML